MPALTPWPEVVAPVRERFGELIDAACRWHTDRGGEVDPDLFALICAGSLPFDENGPAADLAPLVWTRIGVRILLRCGVPNWCNVNSATTWPLDVVPATWQWLDFLHHTGRLDPRSDPLWELRKPLICYGRLDFEGRFLPEGDPTVLIPCECYLPYRQSVNYLNGQLEAGSLSPDVLFEDMLFEDGADGRPHEGDPARVETRWTSGRGGSGPARGRGIPVRRGRPGRPRKGARG